MLQRLKMAAGVSWPVSLIKQDYPIFGLNGSQVRVIYQPSDFYQELLQRAESSKKRIVLASLYLGTGDKEKMLIQRVEENLLSNKELRTNVLLDWCRGTRVTGTESSASILAQLISKCRDRCRVAMYHTPHLRGLYKRFMPARWNETIGLQHCKIYIFDDSVIISGANLSSDYFTNRQDRYVLVDNCKNLADFYEKFVDKISQFSLQMDEKEVFRTSSEFPSHPYEGSTLEEFKRHSGGLISDFLRQEAETHRLSESDMEQYDTFILPSVQMGPLDIRQDSELTVSLLRSGEPGGRFYFGSGYFNLTREYLHEILHGTRADFDLIMAHPKANGFLGARGAAGGIPHAYTLIANRFFDLVRARGMEDRIRMYEYQREGWTFHAKGLWYYAPDAGLPCLTMVGSPNFGYRSVDKDLETQMTILTSHKPLQEQLHKEQERLFNRSNQLEQEEFRKPERQVPQWVRVVVGVARQFF